MLNRGGYWQCGFVIPKGSLRQIRERGLTTLRDDIVKLAPFVAGRVGKLQDWEEIKLLTVQVDRLRQWYRPGFFALEMLRMLCPRLAVLALTSQFKVQHSRGKFIGWSTALNWLTTEDLRRVQSRREWPTRATQQVQLSIQNRVTSRVLRGSNTLSPPFLLRLLVRFPFLRRLPARLIGIGFCSEHVNTPCVRLN